ncbi:MAG: helix-turn-helix domain-containing protein [Lachnospiraceae bacterium]|nr:helix-turn-helix domain-containing protein [Lachnospiraceae bacterium]
MISTAANPPRINSTNILSGIDANGHYTIHAGRKGQTYHVLPANPPSPDEIKELRKKADFSQREFADAIGVSVSAVSSWENGKKVPDGLACRYLDMLERDGGLIGRCIETEA